MRRLETLLLTLFIGLFCAAVVPSAKADAWNRETIATFHEAVEIPRQILPAGTYVFKLANSPFDRSLVQIWNEDQTQVIATLRAVSTYRLTPSEETIFRFDERTNDAPQALRTWFYPGDARGLDFVYSD